MKTRGFLSCYRESGFTFVEVLVGLTVLSLVLIGTVPLLTLSAKIMKQGGDKIVATNLANKELERIRSLDYDNVGVVSGNPSGTVTADYDATLNGKSYHIKNRVSWVDGEFDGVYPSDPDPRDYKRATVTVSWAGALPADQDVQVSTLVSRESEERVVTGGNIDVTAMDYQGNLLEDVKIDVTTGPSSPTGDWTDAEGKSMFFLLAPSVSEGDYTVTASKDGWLVRPDDRNQTCTVLVNQTRTLEFVLGQPGRLIVHLKDASTGEPIDKNSRITLVSTEAGTTEYTSHDGNYDIPNLFPGTYDLTAWAASYNETGPIPVEVPPNETTEIDVLLEHTATGGLHLDVTDQATGAPLGGATVRVTSLANGTEVTGDTSEGGQYEDHFEVGEYEVEISKAGFETWRQNVTIVAHENQHFDVALEETPAPGEILVRTQRSNGRPYNNVRIRLSRTGYPSQEKRTGTYAQGEALFNNLSPGTYIIERWSSGWRYARTVTVTAGQRERVVYTY